MEGGTPGVGGLSRYKGEGEREEEVQVRPARGEYLGQSHEDQICQ